MIKHNNIKVKDLKVPFLEEIAQDFFYNNLVKALEEENDTN